MSTRNRRREREVHAVVRELEVATAAYAAMTRQFADQHRLHATDVEALFHLVRAAELSGPLTAGDLQRLLGVASATTTSVIDRLERAGHARRERDDVDRRRVTVVPTETARRAGHEFWVAVDRRVRQRLRTYDDAELTTVHRFLRDVTRAAEPGPGDPSSAD